MQLHSFEDGSCDFRTNSVRDVPVRQYLQRQRSARKRLWNVRLPNVETFENVQVEYLLKKDFVLPTEWQIQLSDVELLCSQIYETRAKRKAHNVTKAEQYYGTKAPLGTDCG